MRFSTNYGKNRWNTYRIVKKQLHIKTFIASPQGLNINTVTQQPIYLGVSAIDSTNLTLLLSIYGVASQACTLTIKIQLDNTDIAFTPKTKLQIGDNVVGIPLGIPQVQSGPHYVGVYLTVDGGTFTIPIYNLQLMIDGRNLQGGLSAGVPHAEAQDTLAYVNLHAMFTDKFKNITLTDIYQEIPDTRIVSETQASAVDLVKGTRSQSSSCVSIKFA